MHPAQASPDGGLAHGRLTGPKDPDPDGVFHVAHARATTRGGCPLYPQGRRCSPRLATITSPRPPHHSDTSLHPATTIHRCDAPLDETSTRVQAIHPSGLPLACSPRMKRERRGFPPSSAPRDYSQRTSGQGQAYRAPTHTTLHVIDLTSNLACSLNTCDPASHSWMGKCRSEPAPGSPGDRLCLDANSGAGTVVPRALSLVAH
jgi:hypothetical protein